MGLISCKYFFFFGGLSEDKTEYHGIIYDNIIFINGMGSLPPIVMTISSPVRWLNNQIRVE